MARGWESKAVESQIQDAGSSRPRGGSVPAPPVEPVDLERQAKLRCLMLNRTRVQGELLRCSNPRFRTLLEAELAYLESEIGKYQA